jgi:hypothetical protein
VKKGSARPQLNALQRVLTAQVHWVTTPVHDRWVNWSGTECERGGERCYPTRCSDTTERTCAYSPVYLWSCVMVPASPPHSSAGPARIPCCTQAKYL